jgi:hypothetical protein
MTLKEFNEGFNKLLDYYPNTKGTENLSILYFAALSELTIQEFERAIGKIIKEYTGEFLPKVPTILKYAKSCDIDSQIILAKKMLQRGFIKVGSSGMVNFEDKGIHAVVDYVGWRRLCNMLETEKDNFMNFQFDGIYKGFMERPYEVPLYFVGEHQVFGQTQPVTITYASIGVENTESLNFIPLDYKPVNRSLEMKENIRKLQDKMLIGANNG